MYVFELEFRLPKGAKKKQYADSPFRPSLNRFTVANAVRETIGILLVSWEINGQVLGRQHTIAKVRGGYRVFVRTPAKDALARRHHSDEARKALRHVTSKSLSKLKVRRVGRVPWSRRECPGHPDAELILYVDVYRDESPLRCAECFGPVPLYMVPPGRNGDRQEITWWASGYRDCHELLSRKGAANAFARNELESPESDLSRSGREICERIASATGRRTWYFLLRARGLDPAAERERRCPRCGGEWLLPEPWHREFDFRCERCALLSRLRRPNERDDDGVAGTADPNSPGM